MNRKLLTFIGIAIAAVAVYILLPEEYTTLEGIKGQQASLRQFTEENLFLAAGVYFGVYILVTGLSLPGAAVLTLAGGAVFGLVKGVIIVSFASTIGATLAFLLSRFLFRESIEQKFPNAIEKINRGIQKEGAFYLFALRLVPAFPFFLINLVMGITGFSLISFFWVSQLGMLPGTIAYVFAGTQLAQVSSLGDVLSPGLLGAFVALGLLPLVSKWVVNYIKQKRIYAPYEKPEKTDYNIIAIGAGSAGLVTSYIASAVKAKVALIERHKMGGDCLNTGCVPSKALIRSAKALHEISRAKDFGLTSASAEFDFANVMERVQSVIQEIEPHDSVERYTGLGVDVIEGEAKILDPFRVQVNGKVLTTRNIIVATGARPFVPELPGLSEVTHYNSDTVWSLREKPKRMLVLGGGPIGSELAQAFHRLGSQVTVLDKGKRTLSKEDPKASEAVMAQFKKEGIEIRTEHRAKSFGRDENGEQYAICDTPNGEVRIEFDVLLIALGRRANVTGFGLEELGVSIRNNGTIDADDFLRTNFPNIFVCGDVTGPYQFTHVAAHQAWYTSVNALFQPLVKYAADYRVIPRATFTDPEVAHVGLTEEEADQKKLPYKVSEYGIDDLDRAIADSDAKGFVKVLTRAGSDEILGVTIVGVHAGDILAEYVLAMKYRIGLNKILGTIHTYPTLSEANKYAAGVWKRETSPAWVMPWLEWYHSLRRGDSTSQNGNISTPTDSPKPQTTEEARAGS